MFLSKDTIEQINNSNFNFIYGYKSIENKGYENFTNDFNIVIQKLSNFINNNKNKTNFSYSKKEVGNEIVISVQENKDFDLFPDKNCSFHFWFKVTNLKKEEYDKKTQDIEEVFRYED